MGVLFGRQLGAKAQERESEHTILVDGIIPLPDRRLFDIAGLKPDT